VRSSRAQCDRAAIAARRSTRSRRRTGLETAARARRCVRPRRRPRRRRRRQLGACTRAPLSSSPPGLPCALIHVGLARHSAGRAGEFAAIESLRRAARPRADARRLKTGTSPRLRRSDDRLHAPRRAMGRHRACTFHWATERRRCAGGVPTSRTRPIARTRSWRRTSTARRSIPDHRRHRRAVLPSSRTR